MNKKCLSDAYLSTALLCGLFLVSSATSALTWSFNDPCTVDILCNTSSTNPYTAQYAGPALYYGGDGAIPSTPTSAGDVIGYPGSYDILNLTSVIDATDLTVSVLTRFYPDPNPGVDGQSNVLYGDLLLSTNPYAPFTNFGTAPSPYPLDTAYNTGTVWNYAVSTSSAGISDWVNGVLTGGQGDYAIIYQNPSLTLSDVAPHDTLFRAGQYVLYTDNTGTGSNNNVTVTISHPDIPDPVDGSVPSTGTLITYKIPLSDIALVGGVPLELSGIAVRWAMTCANDIVEAEVIPEPETLALFVSGLLSLVLFSRSKKPVGDDTLRIYLRLFHHTGRDCRYPDCWDSAKPCQPFS